MQAYKVLTKCRLVDLNKYLDKGSIFVPETDDYNRTSRSLAAALRVGWIVKISDKEVEKLEKKALVQVKKPELETKDSEEKPVNSEAVDMYEMNTKDLADEVVGDKKDILAALDKQKSTLAKSKVETADEIKKEIKEKTKKRKLTKKKSLKSDKVKS